MPCNLMAVNNNLENMFSKKKKKDFDGHGQRERQKKRRRKIRKKYMWQAEKCENKFQPKPTLPKLSLVQYNLNSCTFTFAGEIWTNAAYHLQNNAAIVTVIVVEAVEAVEAVVAIDAVTAIAVALSRRPFDMLHNSYIFSPVFRCIYTFNSRAKVSYLQANVGFYTKRR